MSVGKVDDLEGLLATGAGASTLGAWRWEVELEDVNVRIGAEAEEGDAEELGGLGTKIEATEGLVDDRGLQPDGSLAHIVVLDLGKGRRVLKLRGPWSVSLD